MSEGEDSPQMPARRRIKKVMVVSSASESESDESVIVASTRRKRMRVVSDDDGASSSSSNGSAVVARRKRALPALRDSDSDTSGWATDHSDVPRAPVAAPPAAIPTASGFASDSSEGNSDKCSICLLRFKDQEIGTPESCEHIFCVDCIGEWSKNVNTCPVDRMTFNSITVRTCVGGRVVRIEPVKVVERRPSVDVLVVEDPTPCEICGSTENEETMLLCDGCDLGFHMQCLTPPLTEVPADRWLCPACDDLLDVIHLSELDDLFTGIEDLELPDGPRVVALREPRNVRRSARTRATDEPSTSSGRTSGAIEAVDAIPSTSRGNRIARSSRSAVPRAPRRRATGTTRRIPKKRRARTVIIEYEVQENGKFPVTKTVKRKIKKRKSRKRQPRTAARRSHVRASVRAKLAHLRLEPQHHAHELAGAAAGVQQLCASRQRAGIPALSLFGNPHQLDYFSEEEYDVAEGTSVAVAARPNHSAISAYRQARRKMVSIPSPPHASAAPDILSSILESQSRLHSKKSIVSISVDGQVDIKLEKRDRPKKSSLVENRSDAIGDRSGRVDVRVHAARGEDAAKKTPAYPGGHQQRSGGWGGGYRGGRVPPAAPHAHHYASHRAAPAGPPGPHGPPPGAGPYRGEGPADYGRRPHYSPADDFYDRNRLHNGRGQFPPRPDRGRFGMGPAWRFNRQDIPNNMPARHSFGGFDNPLDMRTGFQPPPSSAPATPEASLSAPPRFGPLPEPPSFLFGNKPDEEEEASELVIDTEKYDPMEPTNDEEDDEELTPQAPPVCAPEEGPLSVQDSLDECPPAAPPAPPAMQNILAEIDTNSLNVSSSVLDTAVRQVLEEHRNRNLIDQPVPQRNDYSGEDSDGDCPNFSIYSATSVHIASTSNMEENSNSASATAATASRTKQDEYNEKVSKRCPITTNTRNPIKIKLHTPSLIKRPVSLYDDEDEEPADDAGINDPTEPATPESDPQTPDKQSNISEAPEEEPLQETADIGDKPDDIIDENKLEEAAEVESNATEDIKTPEPPEQETSQTPDNAEAELPTSQKEEDEQDPPEAEAGVTALENGDKSDEEELDDTSEKELQLTPGHKGDAAKEDVEKMTESISETEDERSYTPCLDENKPKDTSLETEKDKGIEGLDTEMISEEEGQDMFSDEQETTSPTPAEDTKKKKKKEAKKESKDKKSKTKKGDVTFKKLSKTSKDRNYRDKDKNKDKDTDKSKREKSDAAERKAKRKEKRKDLERYDVRTVVSEKRKRVKDAFGRDVSPPSPSPPPSGPPSALHAHPHPPAARRHSLSPAPSPSPRRRKSASPRRRSIGRKSISPRRRSISPRRRSISPRRRSIGRKSISPRRRAISPIRRRSISPIRRRSVSPRRVTPTPRRVTPTLRRGVTPTPRRGVTPTLRRGVTPTPRRRSPSPRKISPRKKSISPRRKSISPRRRSTSRGRKRRSTSRTKKRRRSASRSPKPKGKKKKRERVESRPRSPKRKSPKRKRVRRSRSPSISPPPVVPPIAWSPPSVDSRLLSPRTPPPGPEHGLRRRHRRRARSSQPSKEVFTSGDNILVSVSFNDQERTQRESDKRRRREARKDRRKKRRRAAAAQVETTKPVAIIDLERSPFRELTPSPKNVIVLSDSEHGDGDGGGDNDGDGDGGGGGAGEREAERERHPAPPAPAAADHTHVGPKTPPEPPVPVKFTIPSNPARVPALNPLREETEAEAGAAVGVGPSTPPDSPDAYDPFEPTRSPSPSASASPPPAPVAAGPPSPPRSPPRTTMTLEAAQKTNMSADDVIDRRPISPIEKVMALLQSTRDVSPEPPPGDASLPPEPPHQPHQQHQAPTLSLPPQTNSIPPSAPTGAAAPRIVLPSPTRSAPPKLFLAKPSPIKSNPVKPMQATKISRLPLPLGAVLPRGAPPAGDSPYSPGSSDFGDLFEPPPSSTKGSKRQDSFDSLFDKPARRRGRSAAAAAAKVPVKLNRKKGKTHVGVKIDEDNLKILDDLPSSAVEMQVKSKFLKKLNRQERVVEEVKLVLKPHYNKKHVTKDEYKDILRRAVPKICHNKSGEINPSKIQALVEAYVKKFRKKHKLGLA